MWGLLRLLSLDMQDARHVRRHLQGIRRDITIAWAAPLHWPRREAWPAPSAHAPAHATRFTTHAIHTDSSASAQNASDASANSMGSMSVI